jgi:hypothetical protein
MRRHWLPARRCRSLPSIRKYTTGHCFFKDDPLLFFSYEPSRPKFQIVLSSNLLIDKVDSRRVNYEILGTQRVIGKPFAVAWRVQALVGR